MMAVPETLDGAVVHRFVEAPDLGTAEMADGPDAVILAVAIARYEDSHTFYVFALGEKSRVLGELAFDTEEEAMREAERYYELEPELWKRRTRAGLGSGLRAGGKA
jgi:hypothetical protein